MAAGTEAAIEVDRIRQDMLTIQATIDRAMRQLNDVNTFNIRDDTPYFSFKTAERIEDLKGSGLGLRARLQNDILQGKLLLKQLEQKARRIQAGERALLIERQHEALLRADKQARRTAMTLIDRAANSGRGGLSEAEFAEVQKAMLSSLKGHIDFLRHHPSRDNLKETLDMLGQVYTLGMVDAQTSKVAMDTIQAAARRFVDAAKSEFLKNPTPAKAAKLIDEIANSALLGGEDASGYITTKVVPTLKQKLDDAEKRFRNTPTTENCEAMFNAEAAYVGQGGAPLSYPPKGLKRIKQGTTRLFGPKDMLSAVSKEYYGSFSYWDAIVKANWGIFRDPEAPHVNVTITIPH
jgi:hypothetical protein